MDLLNFSFWSEKNEDERFAVEYEGQKWTGYNSLVAALQRALDEGSLLSVEFYVLNSRLTMSKTSQSHLQTSGKTKMNVP